MTAVYRSGKCKGGPWDGQELTHYANSKALFEPRTKFSLSMRFEDDEVIPTKVGEYYWGNNEMWIWLPQ